METSSANSNYNMLLLFHGFSCYYTVKSYVSRYWSFSPQSQTSGCDLKNQKSGFSSKEVLSGGERLCRKEVEILMGNLGIFCSQESEEQLNESYGCEEISRLFEKEPSLEEELQRVLCVLGLKQGLKLENCNNMINNFDEDGDGRIDFQEFVKFMENSFC
ncbi:hypothetical protein ES332_A05G413600v1 [Gossypium tomentosum]|uniref:EF-hand domain-containing protein n=1 Tax=Gossypium tomentosum TaxID=34277 RepID=A0A5D2QR12_GOSTO|nr:hypothetical protein ES332_A05G413600v1 [Gossypium tomentosum]